MLKRIVAQFKSNRCVSVGQGEYKLVEVAVSDNEKFCATTVDIAALFDECEQRRVYEQLFRAGAAFFHTNGERITELWVLGDIDSVKQQLGAEASAMFF